MISRNCVLVLIFFSAIANAQDPWGSSAQGSIDVEDQSLNADFSIGGNSPDGYGFGGGGSQGGLDLETMCGMIKQSVDNLLENLEQSDVNSFEYLALRAHLDGVKTVCWTMLTTYSGYDQMKAMLPDLPNIVPDVDITAPKVDVDW